MTRRGLTLVEMLAVVAIVGLLMALLLPAVQSARESARRTQCGNNFKQATLGVLQHLTLQEVFPAGELLRHHMGCGDPIASGVENISFSWSTKILPYIEMHDLAASFDWNADGAVYYPAPPVGGWKGIGPFYAAPNINASVSGATVSTYLCPSDSQADARVNMTGAINNGAASVCGDLNADDVGRTNIVGVSGANGWCLGSDGVKWPKAPSDGVLFNFSQTRAAAIRDGTSQTLLLAEVTGGRPREYAGFSWVVFATLDTSRGINGGTTVPGGVRPCGFSLREQGFSSYHPGGCLGALADGSVRFLSHDIAQATLNALGSRRGGAAVGEY